jgi:hypothetical protein
MAILSLAPNNPKMSYLPIIMGQFIYTIPALVSFEGDLESVSSQYLVNTKQQIWDLETLLEVRQAELTQSTPRRVWELYR